jgi:hypothetical protein
VGPISLVLITLEIFEKTAPEKGSVGRLGGDRRFLTLVEHGIAGQGQAALYHATTFRGRAELPLNGKQWRDG